MSCLITRASLLSCLDVRAYWAIVVTLMKAEHPPFHKSDIVSALVRRSSSSLPGNSPVAGLHLQLAHMITGPRAAADGGDPFRPRSSGWMKNTVLDEMS